MEQQRNVKRRNRRTREQIENLFAEFTKTGSTVKDFCKAHSVSAGTFHKWQARYKSKTSKKKNRRGFTPVVIDSSLRGLFAEVKGVRFYQPVSADYLKQFLA